jgi:hypothetical protein
MINTRSAIILHEREIRIRTVRVAQAPTISTATQWDTKIKSIHVLMIMRNMRGILCTFTLIIDTVTQVICTNGESTLGRKVSLEPAFELKHLVTKKITAFFSNACFLPLELGQFKSSAYSGKFLVFWKVILAYLQVNSRVSLDCSDFLHALQSARQIRQGRCAKER